MSHEIDALRMLTASRRRRGERLLAALAQARAALSEQTALLRGSESGAAASASAEQRGFDERDRLMGSSFTPHALQILGFRLQDLAGATAAARANVTSCRLAVERQKQAVSTAQAEVRRNDQRLAGLQEHLDHLLLQRELAEQEREDDEVNEAAVARLSTRQRPQG